MPLQPNEVKTENIANGAVTTPKIADEAVTSAKLKDSSVKTEKIATGAITGSKIAEGQIYGSKLRDGAVRTEKIASGAVTTAKIGELQVTGSRLQDRAVTTEKLANSAVTTEKIANGAVTPVKLSFTPPAIQRPIIPPVVSSELGVGSVETENLADASVTLEKLAETIKEALEGRFHLLPKPKWLIEPLTVNNAIPWTELELATDLPEGTLAVAVQLGVNPLGPAPAVQRVTLFVATPPNEDAPYPLVASAITPLLGWTDMIGNANAGIVPVSADRKIMYKVEIPEGGYLAVISISLTGYIK